MRLLTGAGTLHELDARGSAHLSCIILPNAVLLAIIAFADECPLAVLAITLQPTRSTEHRLSQRAVTGQKQRSPQSQ
jgi:hypothetical protein